MCELKLTFRLKELIRFLLYLCVTIIMGDSGDTEGYPGCDNKARRNEEEDRERKEGVFAEGAGSES